MEAKKYVLKINQIWCQYLCTEIKTVKLVKIQKLIKKVKVNYKSLRRFKSLEN